MPAPTPDIRTQEDEYRLHVSCVVDWTSADDLSDEVIVDASALGYDDLHVQSLWARTSPGLSWTLEFDDDTTDELIWHHPEGLSAVSVNGPGWQTTYVDSSGDPLREVQIDFFMHELRGLSYQGSGGTGDMVLTTSGAVSGHSLSFILYLWRPGGHRERTRDHRWILHANRI